MASVKIILRTNKIKKNGKAPLYVRIIQNRKPRYKSLGIEVEPKFWDAERERVKSGHPNSGRFNAFLARKKAEYEALAVEINDGKKSLREKRIREAELGGGLQDYIAFAERMVERLSKQEKFGTATVDRTSIK
ncbi:MAG: Arm DNA-binding domain-containing protein, partial [Bacteroidota bacterium]